MVWYSKGQDKLLDQLALTALCGNFTKEKSLLQVHRHMTFIEKGRRESPQLPDTQEKRKWRLISKPYNPIGWYCILSLRIGRDHRGECEFGGLSRKGCRHLKSLPTDQMNLIFMRHWWEGLLQCPYRPNNSCEWLAQPNRCLKTAKGIGEKFTLHFGKMII